MTSGICSSRRGRRRAAARPAEGDQPELARVEAPLDGHQADRLDHVGVGDPSTPSAASSTLSPSGSRSASAAPPGQLDVERHAPVEEEIVADASEHEVRVGVRRLRRRPCRSRRARIRAGALRAAARVSGRVEPGDRAAAGADRDRRRCSGSGSACPTRGRTSVVICGSPSRTTAMSALVPPMSKQTTFCRPARPRRRRRDDAAAGPEFSVLTDTPLA